MSSTFHRMRHPSSRKPSGRPSTSDGTAARDKDKAFDSEPEREKRPSPSLKERSPKDAAVLRKRTSSTSDVATRPPAEVTASAGAPVIKPGKRVLEQIGTPDHSGWLRKKNDQFNSWRMRYLVLKGPHLYLLKSNDKSVSKLWMIHGPSETKSSLNLQETKIKAYIHLIGYKVVADENIDPGRYGFKIVHDNDKTHFFSHDEQLIIREWMKAMIKATISRDFTSTTDSIRL
jgi:hypothetical protein